MGERTPSPPPGLPSGMLLGPRGGVTLRSERFGDLGFTWLAGFVRRSATNCSGMQTPDISGGGERLRRGPVPGLELNFHSAGETGENLRVSFSAHPPSSWLSYQTEGGVFLLFVFRLFVCFSWCFLASSAALGSSSVICWISIRHDFSWTSRSKMLFLDDPFVFKTGWKCCH